MTVTARPLEAGKLSVTVALAALVVPCEFLALYVKVQVPADVAFATNEPSGWITTAQEGVPVTPDTVVKSTVRGYPAPSRSFRSTPGGLTANRAAAVDRGPIVLV